MTLFPLSPVIEITVPPVNLFLYQSVIDRSGLHDGTVPVIADRVHAESVLDDRRKVRSSAHYPRNNLRESWFPWLSVFNYSNDGFPMEV